MYLIPHLIKILHQKFPSNFEQNLFANRRRKACSLKSLINFFEAKIHFWSSRKIYSKILINFHFKLSATAKSHSKYLWKSHKHIALYPLLRKREDEVKFKNFSIERHIRLSIKYIHSDTFTHKFSHCFRCSRDKQTFVFI